MNAELIEKAITSAEDGHALLVALDESVAAWLADSSLDGEELKEVLVLEALARHQIESQLIIDFSEGSDIFERFPGGVHLMLGWLHLIDLVLSIEVHLSPFRVSEKALALIGTPTSRFVMRGVAGVPELNEIAGFKTVAALLLLGTPDVEEVKHLLDVMIEANQEYGVQVAWCVGEMEDAIQGVEGKAPALARVEEFLKVMEEGIPKDYNKYYKNVPQSLLGQGYVSSTWATDLDFRGVHLLFGDEVISISHEKTGMSYVRREDVKAMVLGSATERRHSGFSHTDYHLWTLDVYSHSGAIYNFQMTLSSGNNDANPQREKLTKVFNDVGKYYPVTSSGHHAMSESGYQTTMSYWF